MDWRNEMKQMLVAFDRQATHTLDNIKLAFKCVGHTFDQDFKQYFLEASIDQYVSMFDFKTFLVF